MSDSITITQPDDWHVHVRDGEIMRAVIGDTAHRFGRALIMPNLQPPVINIDLALAYRKRILEALPGNATLDPVMALYLTDDTSIETVRQAATNQHIGGFKLYPAGATTNSAQGVTRLAKIMPVLEAMAEHNVILQIHGEVTDTHIDIFDRESEFIDQILDPLIRDLPELKVIFEHITTTEAVEFVKSGNADKLAATITPQHLMYSRNVIFQGGIRPHYYCLPILKREKHRYALLEAATSGDRRFFLGTDSAPHLRGDKESDCGCAGCYSAHAAIELYAGIFDQMEKLSMLEGFASFFGADYYGLERNSKTVTLQRNTWNAPKSIDVENGKHTITPLDAAQPLAWQLV